MLSQALPVIAMATTAAEQLPPSSNDPSSLWAVVAALLSAVGTFLAWLAARSSAATQKAEATHRATAWQQRADGLAISLRYELELAALLAWRAVAALLVSPHRAGVDRAIEEILWIRTPVLDLVILDTSVVRVEVGKGVLLAHTDLTRMRGLFGRFNKGTYDVAGLETLKDQLGALAQSLDTAYKQIDRYSGQNSAKDLKSIVDSELTEMAATAGDSPEAGDRR